VTAAEPLRAALAVIRRDISGSRLGADRRAVERYAATAGLELARILEIPVTALDATRRILVGAREADVEVIVAPTLAHVDRARREITAHRELRVADTEAV